MQADLDLFLGVAMGEKLWAVSRGKTAKKIFWLGRVAMGEKLWAVSRARLVDGGGRYVASQWVKNYGQLAGCIWS